LVEGNFIDIERSLLIPSEFVGRMLSPVEARQLEEMLNGAPPGHGTERRPRAGHTTKSRRLHYG
jgi:hypothetical protein